MASEMAIGIAESTSVARMILVALAVVVLGTYVPLMLAAALLGVGDRGSSGRSRGCCSVAARASPGWLPSPGSA